MEFEPPQMPSEGHMGGIFSEYLSYEDQHRAKTSALLPSSTNTATTRRKKQTRTSMSNKGKEKEAGSLARGSSGNGNSNLSRGATFKLGASKSFKPGSSFAMREDSISGAKVIRFFTAFEVVKV